MYDKYHNLSLDELAREAEHTNNELALSFVSRFIDDLEKERAARHDEMSEWYWGPDTAIEVMDILLNRLEWHKTEDTKKVLQYSAKRYEPDNCGARIYITRQRGYNNWLLTVVGGVYNEEQKEATITGQGFKKAQEEAVQVIVAWLKDGFQLYL